MVWSSWAFAIAALGLADMTPLVRQVYDDGRIDPFDGTFADFEKDLAETLATGRPAWFLGLGNRAPIDDTIAELSTWYGFSEAYLEAERRRERLASRRVLRPGPAVGACRAEGWPQRSLSLRQRQEVQEVLPALTP